MKGMKATVPLPRMDAGRKRSHSKGRGGSSTALGGAASKRANRSGSQSRQQSPAIDSDGTIDLAEREMQDPIALQAQNLNMYLQFLRSHREYVVQIDMDLQHAGHILYALPDAAYCRDAGACVGIMESAFLHIQGVPLPFCDGVRLVWECGCEEHQRACAGIQAMETAHQAFSCLDVVAPCLHVLAMESLAAEGRLQTVAATVGTPGQGRGGARASDGSGMR